MECVKTRKLCRLFEQCNALTFAVVGGRMQQPGWPDRYVAHAYWSGWLEMKEKGRLSQLQRKVLQGLHERGASAYVLRFDGSQVHIEGWDGSTLLSRPLPGTPGAASDLLRALGRLSRPSIPGAVELELRGD